MNELALIDSVKTQDMVVTWDMGRRCNFDCTYCPSHRHDNFSLHAKLEELKRTAKFILDYIFEMKQFSHSKEGSYRLNLTGGEPTVHPQFIKFGEWLKQSFQEEEKYKNSGYLNLSLTSNGAFSKKISEHLIKVYNFITISYHCEAQERLKKKVKKNIMYLKEKGVSLNVNVMFHAKTEYFKECVELCESLKSAGVDFIPRMIGEHNNTHNNKYHHWYTSEQLNWMKDYWFKNKKKSSLQTDIVDKSKIENGGGGILVRI